MSELLDQKSQPLTDFTSYPPIVKCHKIVLMYHLASSHPERSRIISQEQ